VGHTLYGQNVLIAGNFPGPSSTQKNLVLVKGAGPNAGQVIRWYNSSSLKSVLAAPGLGRVYGGGVSLSAFDFATGKKLWTKAKTTVDLTIRTHDSSPAYRDLELDADGQTIWAACIYDAVDGKPAKALIKLDIEGNHDAS
jgi:outer membrane protein assembly factor BamB